MLDGMVADDGEWTVALLGEFELLSVLDLDGLFGWLVAILLLIVDLFALFEWKGIKGFIFVFLEEFEKQLLMFFDDGTI
jgi:hypothetical protein